MFCRNLKHSGFKTGVAHECRQLFENITFNRFLDNDPCILGVGNGILKLGKYSEFISGYHDYFISRYTSTVYKKFDPRDSITKKLLLALRNIFRDDEPDSFEFMMYYFASSLDGRKKEGLFLMFIGTGANGKTFWTELHKEVLEMYAHKLPLTTITSKQRSSEGASPALMSIEGRRFIDFSESDKCEKANVPMIKRLTGQERITGRQLYGELRNIENTGTFMLATNHLLEFQTNEHSVWRRNVIVHAKIKFCKSGVDDYNPDNMNERIADPSFARDWTSDEEVKSRYLGIMVYYYEKLQRDYEGIVENVPHLKIKKETEEYRNKQDHINNFITSRIVVKINPNEEDDGQYDIHMNILIEKYTRWFESFNPEAKGFTQGLESEFEGSILKKIMTTDRIGKIFPGCRILDGNENPENNEKYFVSKPLRNDFKNDNVLIETGEQFHARICNEFDEIELMRKTHKIEIKPSKSKNNFKFDNSWDKEFEDRVAKSGYPKRDPSDYKDYEDEYENVQNQLKPSTIQKIEEEHNIIGPKKSGFDEKQKLLMEIIQIDDISSDDSSSDDI